MEIFILNFKIKNNEKHNIIDKNNGKISYNKKDKKLVEYFFFILKKKDEIK
tara:strand:+ start:532 stop:684 length:153 start_codon:yes stop_codon:yes gene_type:complete